MEWAIRAVLSKPWFFFSLLAYQNKLSNYQLLSDLLMEVNTIKKNALFVNDRLIHSILLCVLLENISLFYIGVSPKFSSLIAAYGFNFEQGVILSVPDLLKHGTKILRFQTWDRLIYSLS